jgi:uncharacterized membrane protein YqjE
MPDIPASLVYALKELYAFRTFLDSEIVKVAQAGDVIDLKPGDQVLVPAGPEAPFYMVISGRLDVEEDRGGNKQKELSQPKAGQFFGADWILYNKNCRLVATAASPVKALRINPANLIELLQTLPAFRSGLLFAGQMKDWLRKKAFNWIGEEELVYLISRKHLIFLFLRLIQPVLVFLAAFLLFGFSSIAGLSSLQVVLLWSALLTLTLAVVWTIWRYVDWSNDYYVITDQRIAWIEQVWGLYESRREAFLSSIRNKQVATSNWFERRFGFGDLIITVFAGEIVFKNIPEPAEASRLIDMLLMRSERRHKKQNVQETQKLILDKIKDVSKIMQEEEEPFLPQPALRAAVRSPSLPSWQEIMAYFRIETRFQQGEVVTYRTHLLFLALKLFLPTLAQVAVLAFAAFSIQANLRGETAFPSIPTTLVLAFLLSLFAAAWALYHFSDWRNDIYQITPDRVLDKDHKPFQEESVVQAFISNILSMEIERENLFELLFNYGTVIINSGTDQKLTFDKIPNPTRAQQDIYNRLYQLRNNQEQAEMRKQVDQSALLLATYHLYEESRRRNASAPRGSAPEENPNSG